MEKQRLLQAQHFWTSGGGGKGAKLEKSAIAYKDVSIQPMLEVSVNRFPKAPGICAQGNYFHALFLVPGKGLKSVFVQATRSS